MTDKRPFYPHSYEEAKNSDNVDIYKQSFAANKDCKNAIEEVISKNYDYKTYILGGDSAKEVIDKFGFDRVKYVLANSVQRKSHDGRISSHNKKWAKETFVPEDIIANADQRRYFSVDKCHVGLLDIFVNQFIREYKALDLWTAEQMNSVSGLDFTDKLMVLDPSMLKDEYKTRDYQLVYCKDGFGCSPTARGRSVFGEFFKDGEKIEYQRSDFIGEAKPEFLPDWAKEKLNQKSEVGINEKLFNKLKAEYDGFIDEVKALSPEEIINKAYEIVFKEDIMRCFEIEQIDFDKAQALYSLEKPLASMYEDWLEFDTSYMDSLRDSIDDSISSAMQFAKEKPSVLDKLAKAKAETTPPKPKDKVAKSPDKEVL